MVKFNVFALTTLATPVSGANVASIGLAGLAATALSLPQDACAPSGGCCDFSGTWWNEHPPTNGPSHNFTQSNCSIAFPWNGCSGAMGTASGDTLNVTCTNFYGGKLTGTLELGTPYDVLKWSNGAGWSRVSA
jgi:hypothetical protein